LASFDTDYIGLHGQQNVQEYSYTSTPLLGLRGLF
jgi:hypothetical protein